MITDCVKHNALRSQRSPLNNTSPSGPVLTLSLKEGAQYFVQGVL